MDKKNSIPESPPVNSHTKSLANADSPKADWQIAPFPPIPVFRPLFGEEEVEAMREVFASGWLGMGPKVRDFEIEFARYLGVDHAVAVNSCTAALHLALHEAGVKGGEVITTPFTFVSTNHAILYNEATPVFCDIEEDTLNLDAHQVEKLITPNTKAILCVHFGGHACDMDALSALAKKYHLALVEDVAHGCGGGFKNQKLGSIGDFACFSFQAVKNMSTGDGGMVVTKNAAAAERLRQLRWMGITRDTWQRSEGNYAWDYDVPQIGWKYQMNDIAGALGLVQLKKLETMNALRAQLTTRYDQAFLNHPSIQTPIRKTYAQNSYHNYVIRVKDRNNLNKELQSVGIATGVHYVPNNSYSMFKSFRGVTPVADKVWKQLLTLPLYPGLPHAEQDRIIDAVKNFVQ